MSLQVEEQESYANDIDIDDEDIEQIMQIDAPV